MAFVAKEWFDKLIRLDDTVFESMVLICFPQVYRNFAAGQRKDAKINMVLSHCLQIENEEERTTAVLSMSDFIVQLEAAGRVRSNGPVEAPAFEMAHLYNFDLSQQVNTYYNYILDDKGFLGLAIPCTIPALIENLCERVCLSIGRSRVETRRVLPLNPRDTDTAQAIQLVRNEYMHRLKRKGIVFGVQNVEKQVLLNFWAGLTQDLQVSELQNWMIVILPVDPADSQGLPENIVVLPRPAFSVSDVEGWVRKVAEHFGMSDELIRDWIRIIMKRYQVLHPPAPPELDITGIYNHFDLMIDFLKDNPTLSEIQEELENWR